ncbi:type II secretion system protein GspD [Pararhodospirillum oryzae]|uniref:Type II and III secretion system protein n=1 Tax=Pararhodospirillum oryzae TaxID=478448 RepID=A0A512HBL4_9PROT|nr:type II and III secretion system protein [Pararhodospirillum oryzae]GEO82847.1 type II and III secretion system protein [Pararhodospirillum oryzae]
MLVLALAACAGFDPAAGLGKTDYQALEGNRAAASPEPQPPIPAPMDPARRPLPPPESGRRVTLVAEHPTPVTEVLVTLARVAGLDLDLEPGLEARVVITARDRPLPEILERLAGLANARLALENGVLVAGPDRPRPVTYRLDALNLSRAAEGSVSTSTDVFARVGDAQAGAGSHGNASASRVASRSEADVWTEVSAGLAHLLGVRESRPDAAPAPSSAASSPRRDAASRPAPSRDTDAASDAPPAPQGREKPRTGFHINRQAGVITVVAPQARQREVAAYLDRVRESMAVQVLIEAKILEVSLQDQYRSGIDWTALGEDGDFRLNIPGTQSVVSAPLTDAAATVTLGGTATLGAVDLSTLVQFINRFGAVRTLSSPRLTVMNNQTAVLKVAENEVYFVLDADTITNDGVTRTTYSSQINTVPIGLVMTVQPSVEPGQGRITLGVRPTVSRIASRVADPAVSLQNDAIDSLIPVVEVRELDSVVTIDDGAVVVMGGLMQERMDRVERGVPWLQDVPLVGRLFRADTQQTDVVELIVLLRATVVGGSHAHPADRDLYNTFGPDPRPLSF